MTVHRISSSVLWVVREGVGLALALKRTMTMTSRTSTNSVMAVMIQSRKSWKSDDVVHHRSGGLLEAELPVGRAAEAGQRRAPDAASRTARIVTANSGQSLQTPALPAPSTRLRLRCACRRSRGRRLWQPQTGLRPHWRSFHPGRITGEHAAEPQGESQASQTIIPGRSQCTIRLLPASGDSSARFGPQPGRSGR